MIKRPAPDDPGNRPLDADEIREVREGLEARQYWKRTRDLLSSVSMWSVGVITAVLLIRDQIIDALRWFAKLFGGGTP